MRLAAAQLEHCHLEQCLLEHGDELTAVQYVCSTSERAFTYAFVGADSNDGPTGVGALHRGDDHVVCFDAIGAEANADRRPS